MLGEAGVVQGWAAIIMGIMSGTIPWYTMMHLHKQIRLLKQVDDTMAVFHTHAIAGSLGGILAGFFADPELSRIFVSVDDWPRNIGVAYGLATGRTTAGFRQMGIQLLGIGFVILVNVFTTSTICLLIRFLIPLRLEDDDLRVGDDAIHGEEAYALWGNGERLENSRHNSVYNMEDLPPVVPKDGDAGGDQVVQNS